MIFIFEYSTNALSILFDKYHLVIYEEVLVNIILLLPEGHHPHVLLILQTMTGSTVQCSPCVCIWT